MDVLPFDRPPAFALLSKGVPRQAKCSLDHGGISPFIWDSFSLQGFHESDCPRPILPQEICHCQVQREGSSYQDGRWLPMLAASSTLLLPVVRLGHWFLVRFDVVLGKCFFHNSLTGHAEQGV